VCQSGRHCGLLFQNQSCRFGSVTQRHHQSSARHIQGGCDHWKVALIDRGQKRSTTIIDATNLANGIYIDGIDNPQLGHVVVTGFTIENAKFEGILVANASFVTIWGNRVLNNDKSLKASIPACPGVPAFETAEDFDCGEGVHLSGVNHSTVANNIVEHNGGGILLSDDTGVTQDNLITGNVTNNNPFDCGITLASHPPATLTGAKSPFGVVRNTIAENQSSANGLAIEGAGAGVGIFTFLPGGRVSGNVVIGNRLTGNGLPGVAFHAHTAGEFLNDNVITRNYIAGNGADTEDAATPGPTGINVFGVSPIRGTIISQNVIDHEAVQIAANTPTLVDAHLNNFLDDTLGVDNLGTGSVDATENWWGCPGA
jgi:Right handed beta helix region